MSWKQYKKINNVSMFNLYRDIISFSDIDIKDKFEKVFSDWIDLGYNLNDDILLEHIYSVGKKYDVLNLFLDNRYIIRNNLFFEVEV